jgi:hypothetical protein
MRELSVPVSEFGQGSTSAGGPRFRRSPFRLATQKAGGKTAKPRIPPQNRCLADRHDNPYKLKGLAEDPSPGRRPSRPDTN